MAAPTTAQLLAELEAMRKRHLDEQTALHAHHRALEATHLQNAHAAESALLSTLLALPCTPQHLPPPPQTPPVTTSPTRAPIILDLQDFDSDIELTIQAPPAPPPTLRTPPVPARLLQAFKQHSGPSLLPHHPEPTPTSPLSTQLPSSPSSNASPVSSAPRTPRLHAAPASARRRASPTDPGITRYGIPRRAAKARKISSSAAEVVISSSNAPSVLSAKLLASPLPASPSSSRTLPSRAARASAVSRVAGIVEEERRTRRMSNEALAKEMGGRLSEEGERRRGRKSERGVGVGVGVGIGGRRAFLAERARGDRFLVREMGRAEIGIGEEGHGLGL